MELHYENAYAILTNSLTHLFCIYSSFILNFFYLYIYMWGILLLPQGKHCLYIYRYIYLFIYLFMYLFIYLFIYYIYINIYATKVIICARFCLEPTLYSYSNFISFFSVHISFRPLSSSFATFATCW